MIAVLAFALGFIAATLVCIFGAIYLTAHRTAIERTLNQAVAELKPKGKLFEDEPENLKEWLNELPNGHSPEE